MFGRAAKKENEELRQRVSELEGLLNSLGGGNILQAEEMKKRQLQDIQALEAQSVEVRQEISHLESAKVGLMQERDQLNRELVDSREGVRFQSFGLYDFANPAEDSVRYESELEQVRSRAKDMVRAKQAVTATSGFTFNDSAAKGRSFVNKLSKLALRSYNAEVENAVTRLRAGNLEGGIKRLEKAQTEVSRMGDMINLQIHPNYHALRIREMELAYLHIQAKKALKEQEREERERLREEKRAQAEIQAERKRLEKEQSHYENAIAKLIDQGRGEEADELGQKLDEIRKGIEDADYRAANARAGYVYVISNIGSFGDNMIKIGMTRRLDPMDRVRELGDASVPFNFDVHALHFSHDAVGVEAELHRRFESVKVNRINKRREFFYATAAEVKEELLKIDGSVLEYYDEAEAEQFRLSQKMNNPHAV